ncbi:zinc finger protein Xfin-like [Anneissia japonica]|uniref:zinc finger protein Xfin-like n=1 Tax=Anneissia japonica TaxID=1529436 RepID=UPI001425A020|nr:zinc finger protein Xfin-like [Anneissia japonica]XP_033111201.1 zinc finger protein Xfin-like [Anneissia japonica]
MEVGSVQALVNLDHVWSTSSVDIQNTFVPMTFTFEDGVQSEVEIATERPTHELMNQARSSVLVSKHPLLNNLFLDKDASKSATHKIPSGNSSVKEGLEKEASTQPNDTIEESAVKLKHVDNEIKKSKLKQSNKIDEEEKGKSKTDTSSEETDDSHLIKCMLCQASFKDVISLETHISNNHKVSYYYCSHCRCTFQDVKSLLDHSPNHVLEQMLRFIKSHRVGCSICWQGSPDFKALTDHVMKMHNLKVYCCSSCQFLCLDLKDLAQHEQSHCMGISKETSKFSSLATVCNCKVCGLELETREDVTQHMKMHKAGNMYVCEFCGECFCTRQKVIQHRRVHTGDKPFRCQLCHFSCNRKDNLKGHLRRIHSHADRPLSKKPKRDTEFGSVIKKENKPDKISNDHIEISKVVLGIRSDKLSSNDCQNQEEDQKLKDHSYFRSDGSLKDVEPSVEPTNQKTVVVEPDAHNSAIKASVKVSDCTLISGSDIEKAAVDLGKLPSPMLLTAPEYDDLGQCSEASSIDIDEPSKKRPRISPKINTVGSEISPALFLRGPPEKLLNGNNVSYHSGLPSVGCSDTARRDGSMLMISPDKIFESSPSHQSCSSNLISSSFSESCSNLPTVNTFLGESIASVIDDVGSDYSEYFAEFSDQGDFLQSLGLVKEGAIPEVPDAKASPPRERNIYLEFVKSLEAEGKKDIKKPIKLKGFSHYESTCYKCKEEFDSKQELKGHLHGYKENGKFPCDICNYPLKELRKLMEHRRSHTGEKPYKCNQCDFKCSRRDNLAVHMKKHSR